jgi:hypothetical protein
MTSHDRLFADVLAKLSATVDFWMANGLSAADAVQRALANSSAGPRVRAALAAKYTA